MFSDMRTAVGLQRVNALRADVYPTVIEVLRMATLGGAEALDMADQIGSVTPGKKADLLVIDPATANFGPRFDWIGQVVFNAQPANVLFVFVNGVALKANGTFVQANPTEIVQAAEVAAARVHKALAQTR